MSTKDFYQVIVSDQATKMLISHSVFLSQVDPAAAEHLIIEFEKTSHSLEFMSQRCSWFKADYIPQNKYRFIIFEKIYMMIFQIIDTTVYIDYIVDCRQDYSWLLH